MSNYCAYITLVLIIIVYCLFSIHEDVVTAVPRYDDDSYAGRILVYNPNDYLTIQAVDARGTQVRGYMYMYI